MICITISWYTVQKLNFDQFSIFFYLSEKYHSASIFADNATITKIAFLIDSMRKTLFFRKIIGDMFTSNSFNWYLYYMFIMHHKVISGIYGLSYWIYLTKLLPVKIRSCTNFKPPVRVINDQLNINKIALILNLI